MAHKCVGCDRYNIIRHYFPKDYPESMMLCCACLLSCYRHLKVPGTPDTHGYSHNIHVSREWWRCYGEKIEKVIGLK